MRQCLIFNMLNVKSYLYQFICQSLSFTHPHIIPTHMDLPVPVPGRKPCTTTVLVDPHGIGMTLKVTIFEYVRNPYSKRTSSVFLSLLVSVKIAI